jgi:hypothetical protein
LFRLLELTDHLSYEQQNIISHSFKDWFKVWANVVPEGSPHSVSQIAIFSLILQKTVEMKKLSGFYFTGALSS